MNITKPTMDEAAFRFWSAVFSVVTTIGLVFGGLYTVIAYFDARDKDRRNFELQLRVAQSEAMKPFSAKHLELCTALSVATATIVTTSDEKKKQKAVEDFQQLYWGPLLLVEGSEVDTTTQNFNKCLTHENCDEPLRQLAYDVGYSCRKEEYQNWNLGLPNLKRPIFK